MFRKQRSILWAWGLMLVATFYLFTDTAMGDPRIITVRQAALVGAVPPAETIERTVENGVEILEPRSPQAPTGLDEQLSFIPQPIEDEQLDVQLERRRPAPSTPPHIVIDRWQPGVYSDVVVDRREPGLVPPIVTHRYRGPRETPSLIVTHRYRGLRETPSLIVTHRYRGLRETPSLIVTHRIGS